MNRPDWMPPSRVPFTCHRMDVPPPRQEKSGLGLLVSLIGILFCLVGAAGMHLWSAVA